MSDVQSSGMIPSGSLPCLLENGREPPAFHGVITPRALADLVLASPLLWRADVAALRVRESSCSVIITRSNVTLHEHDVPAEVGSAAVARLAVAADLEPLVEANDVAGRRNVARVAIRAGEETAEALVSVWASRRGIDAELRTLLVNGHALEHEQRGALKLCTRCRVLQAPQHPTCERDGGLLVDVDEDASPGGIVGVYRVLDRIGEGSMGVVFAGEHALIGRPVAIKVLSLSCAKNPVIARLFLSEARAACHLSHANLVDVTDFGLLHDGRPYIVMEKLDGESLRTRLARSGAIPPVVALRIARAAALGLEAAHEGGVVHNDVKPSNIMLLRGGTDDDPRLKLIDFGAASPPGDMTVEGGMMVGTLRYMAPERARGEPADGRADIYGLGVVLHEMLSGQSLFKGTRQESTLRAYGKLSLKPPVSPHGVLPHAVVRIVARTLSTEAAERHQTAGEMVADIDRGLSALAREGWRRWLP